MSQIEGILRALTEIQKTIEEKLREALETKTPENVEVVKNKISELSRVLSESSETLPSYDRRKTQGLIQHYTTELSKLTESKPKKFGFRKANPVPKKNDTVDSGLLMPAAPMMYKEPSHKEDVGALKDDSRFEVADLSDTTKIVDVAAVAAQDVHVLSCVRSEITIKGSPGTVHISKLQNCTVIVVPVRTSVFISDCTDCTFLLACQQLRMHSSDRVDVYLHVSSRAIIEDCKNVRFAPLPPQFVDFGSFEECGFIMDEVSYKKVDDFNWLSRGQSPNWSLLPETERKYATRIGTK